MSNRRTTSPRTEGENVGNAERASSETEDENEDAVSEVPTTFHCKLCPGKVFSESEKDIHRAYHRNLRRGRSSMAKQRPGPKSKTRSGTTRSPSPALSASGTIFAPVQSPKERSGSKKSAGQRKREIRAAVVHFKNSKGLNKKFPGG